MIIPELVAVHRWRINLSKAERMRMPTFTDTEDGIDSLYEAFRQMAREERDWRYSNKSLRRGAAK